MWKVLGLLALVAAITAVRTLAAEPAPFAVGRLWQLDKDGADPSYVFGTLHIPDPRVAELPPRLMSLVADVDHVVLELDPRQLMAAAALTLLPNGKTLDQWIGDATLNELIEMGAESGLPPQAVLRMRPMALAAVLSLPPVLVHRMARGLKGVDGQLADAAASHGKAVTGLESAAEQMGALSSMEQGHEAEILGQVVSLRARREETMGRMVEAYLDGDVLQFLTMMRERYLSDDALAETFIVTIIDRRNRLFVERMAPHLAQGNALIALGAAHLPGRGGVLDRLRAEGFRVTRLL